MGSVAKVLEDLSEGSIFRNLQVGKWFMINGFYEYRELSKEALDLWNQDTFKNKRLLKQDKSHFWSPASWVSAICYFFFWEHLQAHQWPRMSVLKNLAGFWKNDEGPYKWPGIPGWRQGQMLMYHLISFRTTLLLRCTLFQLFWMRIFVLQEWYERNWKNVCANAFWNIIFHKVTMFEGVECDCSSWAPVALPKVFDKELVKPYI